MAHRTVTLSDLTQDLLWPRLLRTPSLALAPGRMVMSVIGVVLLVLAVKIPGLWGQSGWAANADSMVDEAVRQAAAPPVTLMAPKGALEALWARWFEVPVQIVAAHPWAALASVLAMCLIWGVVGGAVARSAAVEAASGIRPTMRSSLALSLSKWRSLGGAMIAPPVIVLLIIGLLAAAGWVLFSLAGIKILGGLLYPFMLLGGLMVVLVVLGYVLGWPMLAPAVMSEGSDGPDALLRVYAYVIARPLRLLVYLTILLILLGFSAGVLDFVMTKLVVVTEQSVTAWLGTATGGVLKPRTPLTGGFSDRAAGWLVGFWVAITKVFTAAYVFSFIASGGSVLYLLMRRLTDGQDVGEIWTEPPGGAGSGQVPA